jgi:hypothetical protein
MANTAKTAEFFIGDLDIRVSTDLTKAGELGPEHSIGLLQDAKVTMNTNQVKLQSGFPQRTYASVVTSRELTVAGSFNEYSISNLALMYGDNDALAKAILASPKSSDLTAVAATASSTLTVTLGTGFTAGDTVYVYSKANSSDVFVTSVVSLAVNVITIADPLPRGFAIGDMVSKVISVELGSSDNTKELTIQVVGTMPLDGTPFVYDIWKGVISGSAEVAASTQNFGALAFQIDPLQPTASEIAAGKYGITAVKKAVVAQYAQGRLTKNIVA